MHRLWKEKNKARNEELIKIFTELDMDASGTIDYIRSAVVSIIERWLAEFDSLATFAS